jgi:hypothetical protein
VSDSASHFDDLLPRSKAAERIVREHFVAYPSVLVYAGRRRSVNEALHGLDDFRSNIRYLLYFSAAGLLAHSRERRHEAGHNGGRAKRPIDGRAKLMICVILRPPCAAGAQRDPGIVWRG